MDSEPSPTERTEATSDLSRPTTVTTPTAVWRIESTDYPPSEATQTFTAWVSRAGCVGGVTERLQPPRVEANHQEVMVTFSVRPLPGGECPDTAEMAYPVDLGERLGDRALLDGGCGCRPDVYPAF